MIYKFYKNVKKSLNINCQNQIEIFCHEQNICKYIQCNVDWNTKYYRY